MPMAALTAPSGNEPSRVPDDWQNIVGSGGLPRRAAKRDKNEAAIVAALEEIGATVQPLSGKGIPDLLVGFRGQTFLLEVKDKGKHLTDDQVQWHTWWNGLSVAVVYTNEDAYEALGVVVG